MARYFIGSVLSPYEKEEVAEGDSTFAFTREQANALELTGLPVRMEHHPEMECGKILRSWSETDGSKWVLGKVSGDGFQKQFAQHALDKHPTTGRAYYEGLSLQHSHVQLASKTGGEKAKKEGIEVSLVVEPRRSDSRIVYVESEGVPNSAEIKKSQYILQQTTNKMSTEAEPVKQPDQQPKETQEKSPEANVAGTMSKEAMMQIIIQQQKSLEQKKEDQTSELEELRQLKASIEKQKEEEKARQAEKSYAMANTLVNTWSKTLDKESMSDATKETILAASKAHPEEMLEVLRVAHCASKKAKETEDRFQEYKSMMEKTQLSAQFDAVMTKKKSMEVEPTSQAPVVHAASNKKRKTMSDPEILLKALSQYHSSGSALDHMNNIAKIGQRKPYRPSYY